MATIYGNPTLSTLEIATSLAVTAGQPYFFCARIKFPLPSAGDSTLNVSGPLVLMAGNQEKLNTLLPKSDATVRSYFPNTGATVQIAGSDVLQDPAVFADYIGIYDPSAGTSGQCSLYIDGVLVGGAPQDFPAGESIPEGPLKVVLNCYQEDGKDWEIEDLYCGFAAPSAQDVADYSNGLVPNGDGSTGWQSGLTAGVRASLTGTGYLGGHITESGHTVDHDTIPTGTADGQPNAPMLGGSSVPAPRLGVRTPEIEDKNGTLIGDVTGLRIVFYDEVGGTELAEVNDAASVASVIEYEITPTGLSENDSLALLIDRGDNDQYLILPTTLIDLDA